ncbi:hypothetical protein [Catalinimonas alkaloidigena]|uniref:hypothetical protein n=1 Tax=Catalinimonas alkaloidigena TaxID=1075417 RepID=UPI00115FCB00|nr:hypothetical protein [Catalinimonas alkaloidigena]
MNKLLLIVTLIAVVSCDPPNVLIVENRTGDTLVFSVNTTRPITFESIHVADSLIPDELIKLNSIPTYFNRKLDIEIRDSLNYFFSLYPNNEVLISPSTIGMPFRTVTYMQNGTENTLIGERTTEDLNVELKHKPLRTTIVKLK